MPLKHTPGCSASPGPAPGGFVLTHDRLVQIEPASMKDRQIIEWDKDDVEAIKFMKVDVLALGMQTCMQKVFDLISEFMKVDVLALGMQTCMQKVFDLISEHKNDDLDLATIKQEDAATYAMIRRAEMFITIEDETGPANVVVWPSLFEKRHRVVLGASMMAINGRIQREGDIDFKLTTGCGDEFAHGSPGSPVFRDRPKPVPQPRDIFVRDLHIDTLKVKARNFH